MIRERISYWFPIAECMTDFFNSRIEMVEDEKIPLFKDVFVYTGSKGAARKFPCIEVTWANEIINPLPNPNAGEVELWITVGVRGDDKRPVEAYRMQDELQRKILSCLQGRELPMAINQATGQIGTKLEILKLNSDYEQNRPVMLAVIDVLVSWRQP